MTHQASILAAVLCLTIGVGCSEEPAPTAPSNDTPDTGTQDTAMDAVVDTDSASPEGGTEAGNDGDIDTGSDVGCQPAPPPIVVDCDQAPCGDISIAGDPPAQTPGSFKGYADPHLMADPDTAGRVWLSYSWLEIVQGATPGGLPVSMAVVSNHLARSDDGGASFGLVGTLWPAMPIADPEGSGEQGMLSSETASLTWLRDAQGNVTWFGTHLRYFLRPQTGYVPKFGTSWTVRITAAPSPEQLTTAPETVLGVAGTSTAYGADVLLDELAGLPLTHCAMLNNPSLFTQNSTLYLAVECLAFVGTTLDTENSTMHLFATEPSGEPDTWTWRHAGVLADSSFAAELGSDTIQQPDISLATDGAPILVLTPADEDATIPVGSAHKGCVAVEIASLEPPMLVRDCDGHVVVRARMEGDHLGACTHHAASETGLLAHEQGIPGQSVWAVRKTGLRP